MPEIEVRHFSQPTPEAEAYGVAIMAAIETTSAMIAKAGKATMFADPISAIVGILGSFLAGMPEEQREKVFADIGMLLQIAVEQSLAMGRAQKVQMIRKEGPLQ